MTEKSTPSDSQALSQLAPAKLNLYLHITGRRDDGFHLLDSLIVFADYGDTVSASEAEQLSLTIDGPFGADVPGGEDNLVLKAARALAQNAGITKGADLHLTKRLPVASGIGGGSADAAAALKVLAELWKLSITEEDLCRLALPLGADIPVCIIGRASFVGGIGENIEPAPALPASAIVLLNPGVPASTAEIFKAYGGNFTKANRFSEAVPDTDSLIDRLNQRHNDLTPYAVTPVPAVNDALSALICQPRSRLTRMSGSGATCFALFDDLAQAEAAQSQLSENYPDYWIVATTIKNG